MHLESPTAVRIEVKSQNHKNSAVRLVSTPNPPWKSTAVLLYTPPQPPEEAQ